MIRFITTLTNLACHFTKEGHACINFVMQITAQIFREIDKTVYAKCDDDPVDPYIVSCSDSPDSLYASSNSWRVSNFLIVTTEENALLLILCVFLSSSLKNS
mmetsp:Transcript_17458/g.24074  ORF Transcript_17458/g.24074 Transcript_17458/m.24074 type:complete len:102 (-) Transcript_17458:871-1176(-)